VNELLSICIPTRNREKYLLECLTAFLPLVAPHRVPIYVSDNASEDSTVEMLERFKRERYPLLFFRRNPQNFAIDQNMADVLAMASSRYGWLFGDDDLPRHDAIEKVLSCLCGGYKLVVVNASTHTADYGRQVEERRIKLYEDRTYPEGHHNRLLADTASYITFLGALIVDLASWRSVDHREFLGTDYLHVSVVYRYVVGQQALLCADPLIRMRLQPPTWFSRYFEIEMFKWPRTVWGLPGEFYSDAAKRAVCDERPIASLRRIVAMRGYGHYGRGSYARYIEPDASIGAWQKRVYRAIASLPEGWVRTAFIAYIRLRRLWEPSWHELALFRLLEATKWR
jgi:glycosyltransferase involved in cell wall biosynthesis